MAEVDLIRQRASSYESRLRELDAESEAAVAAHQRETAPIQTSLDEIEKEILNLMTDRIAIPAGLESQRRELIERLHAANEKLTEATARIERLRVEPAAELRRLSVEAAQGAALESQLSAPDAASPQLLVEAFVARQASDWAVARRRAAEKHLKENESLAQTAERDGNAAQASYYRERNTKWAAEVAAARQAEFEAQQTFDAAHRAVLDE